MAVEFKNGALYFGSSPEDLSNVYSSKPYEWDGKNRPNVNDYISPWNEIASKSSYSSAYNDSRKKYNASIAYAKNQMSAALAQYDADLAFWNERDERDYTDPLSQTNRYKEAGYNMGYLYGNVDSGNSAVGYNQESSSFEPADNEANELAVVDTATKVVSSVFGVVTGLVKSGVSLAKLPHEIRLLDSQSSSNEASARLNGAIASLKEYMNSHDMAGNAVDDLSSSFSFAIEEIGYTLKLNQSNESFWNANVQSKFSEYCAQIWQQQATGNSYQESLKFIEGLDAPDWLKGTLIGVVTVVDMTKGLPVASKKSGK